jgi:hypothetical protein
MKVKCFNYDNHGHLEKDYHKLPQINDCIFQSKKISQGGFVAKIGANEIKASNLLKLMCKINNKLVCCCFYSRATN